MARTITDDDLRTWEVFATTGAYGLPEPARVVFHCTSDRERRPRAVEMEGDKAAAEALVKEASEEELSDLFRESEELD